MKKIAPTFIIFALIIINVSVVYANENQELYLIVVPKGFYDNIGLLIELKEWQGYFVEILVVNNNTAEEIKLEIEKISPDYILLIGDVNNGSLSMPAFYGRKDKVTDLYYGTIGYDIHPVYKVGRIPARNDLDLSKSIWTLINYEYRDDYTTMVLDQDAPDYVVDLHLKILDISNSTLLYTYSQDILSTINSGQSILSYSGHGSALGWENFYESNIKKINYSNHTVFSFSCKTSNFEYEESFGEKWITEGKAVVYIGSSNSTYWLEDYYLQDKIMELYISKEYSISELLHNGLLYVEEMNSPEILTYIDYWEGYQIFGDPSLKINISNNNNDIIKKMYLPILFQH